MAVKMQRYDADDALVLEGRPQCLHCSKPLAPFRWREAEWHDGADLYGGYGDNFFCGLTCGWRWAVRVATERWPERRKAKGLTKPKPVRVRGGLDAQGRTIRPERAATDAEWNRELYGPEA